MQQEETTNTEGEFKQEKYTWYRGIPGLISFSTILPLNIHTSIEEMASYTWMWPLIGGLIGVLVGALGYLLTNVLLLPLIITAAVTYSFAIWFTGFHHLDGLIDIGDAVMAHGTHTRKIEIMRDPRIGTGGIALFFMVAITTVACIDSLPLVNIFAALFLSEIAAKLSLVSCCTFSKSIDNGTGRHFIMSMSVPKLAFISIITGLIGFLALNITGILGILGGIIAGIVMAILAKREFGLATGDVLGASNEVGRMLGLLIMIISFIWIG
ncbi:adenosylcobinamide-GDP ribazoletransferase [Methanobacterium alcaliphilum]|uniref:adenosylcobinamide-GDP ribazoletransferase n=1 Tax=Methanobacterium alcaliphilum TaxID=392018 RepID=UPI00200AB3BD|nr:adenosylcobinamide-GDP ribazoletransferase [Methanobacterium alcaliphilum]MCK9150561.1 adenosylcobinamide-GDP ribazoletransferase [Methanobacterium alcaliphilum]